MTKEIELLLNTMLWTVYALVTVRYGAYFVARGWYKGKTSVCGEICEECAAPLVEEDDVCNNPSCPACNNPNGDTPPTCNGQ